jgi:hypothetical protein
MQPQERWTRALRLISVAVCFAVNEVPSLFETSLSTFRSYTFYLQTKGKAERVGFEPTRRFNTAYAISSCNPYVLTCSTPSTKSALLQGFQGLLRRVCPVRASLYQPGCSKSLALSSCWGRVCNLASFARHDYKIRLCQREDVVQRHGGAIGILVEEHGSGVSTQRYAVERLGDRVVELTCDGTSEASAARKTSSVLHEDLLLGALLAGQLTPGSLAHLGFRLRSEPGAEKGAAHKAPFETLLACWLRSGDRRRLRRALLTARRQGPNLRMLHAT